MTRLAAAIALGLAAALCLAQGAWPAKPIRFIALRWMLYGKAVGGQALHGPEETPTREVALRLYTLGSAWFAFVEDQRGSLAVGKPADLAVLSKGYMTVPVEDIGGIYALLTMVGGKIVYADKPYTRFEEKFWELGIKPAHGKPPG